MGNWGDIMLDFLAANFSRVIAFLTIIEFELVLTYRRRYLLNSTKVNTAVMAVSSLIFMDAFIYTVRTYSHPQAVSVPGIIRLSVHLVVIVFLFAFYILKQKEN